MKKFLTTAGILGVASMLPLVAFAGERAQGCGAEGSQGTIANIVACIGTVIIGAIPVAASLALLAFFWGLAIYLFNFGEGKEDKQKQGRNLMVYGILAIFVMVSVFGIARLLQRSFGINENQSMKTPMLDSSGK